MAERIDDETYESASVRARDRQRRATITLAVTLLALFFAFWYAYSYYRADAEAAATPEPTCTAPSVVPGDVKVNVLNSTDRSGLAGDTAATLNKRGFQVLKVANDPLQKDVAGVAQIRHGPQGIDEAKRVQRVVEGASLVDDARTDASVDLVLGATFTKVGAAPEPCPSS